MKRALLFFGSGLVCLPLLISSCQGGESDVAEVDESRINSDTIDDTQQKIQETQNIYYSVPSTSEMANLIQDAGAPYKMELLNDIEKVDKYTSLKKRALNLGIYGADLNYCSIFEKTNETMFYFRCTESLAGELGIDNAISEETKLRAEENIDNRDSMLQIISDMFFELEEYMAENDKDDVSALVIAGGWIEGLYLATQTIEDKNPNQKMLERVGEQKLSLDHMMKLMFAYKGNELVDDVLADFDRLVALYQDVHVEKSPTTVTRDEEGNTVIGGGTKVEITMDQFKEIRKVTAEIRNSYVKI